jgi:hypothetical protein
MEFEDLVLTLSCLPGSAFRESTESTSYSAPILDGYHYVTFIVERGTGTELTRMPSVQLPDIRDVDAYSQAAEAYVDDVRRFLAKRLHGIIECVPGAET